MNKKILLVTICIISFAFLIPGAGQAQTLTDIKAQMIKDWERAKAYTTDYLNAMPADKYSFKPNDSIRSFAGQMLHIAQANVFLMSNAIDKQPPSWLMSNPEKSTTAQQKDSVAYYLNASYDYCLNAIRDYDMSKWNEKKKIFGFEEPRYVLMNKAFEHQAHHRGQTTIYIRLQGIKPPDERLF